MKKICLLAALCVILCIAACASPFSEYENFHTDLDISVRIEDALRKAEEKMQSAFYRDELETLLYDLKSCRVNTPEAQEVNGLYIKCVLALRNAADARLQRKDVEAEEQIQMAVLYYQEGNMRYQDFMTKYSRVD